MNVMWKNFLIIATLYSSISDLTGTNWKQLLLDTNWMQCISYTNKQTNTKKKNSKSDAKNSICEKFIHSLCVLEYL